MNSVIIMESIGNLHMGDIWPTEEFRFLFEGRLSSIDEFQYIERYGPIPLKNKRGLVIWAKFKNYEQFVRVQLLGDVIEDE